MCDLISWIEVKRGGKKTVLFLTDKDVFSKFGRERLAGCQDSDFIGHGAIRRYYGLDDDHPLTGGMEREYRDFWETKELPPEIAEKVKDFDWHFGRMFRECLNVDDLEYIVYNAPSKWRNKAYDELLRREDRYVDEVLLNIVKAFCGASDKLRDKAFQELIRRNCSEGTLGNIVCYATPKWAAKAYDELLKRSSFRSDVFRLIASVAPREWALKAQTELDRRDC